eukprot:356001-Rhodomonas_salina.1
MAVCRQPYSHPYTYPGTPFRPGFPGTFRYLGRKVLGYPGTRTGAPGCCPGTRAGYPGTRVPGYPPAQYPGPGCAFRFVLRLFHEPGPGIPTPVSASKPVGLASPGTGESTSIRGPARPGSPGTSPGRNGYRVPSPEMGMLLKGVHPGKMQPSHGSRDAGRRKLYPGHIPGLSGPGTITSTTTRRVGILARNSSGYRRLDSGVELPGPGLSLLGLVSPGTSSGWRVTPGADSPESNLKILRQECRGKGGDFLVLVVAPSRCDAGQLSRGGPHASALCSVSLS